MRQTKQGTRWGKQNPSMPPSSLRGRENSCTVEWGSPSSQLQPHLDLKFLQLTFSFHKIFRHVN